MLIVESSGGRVMRYAHKSNACGAAVAAVGVAVGPLMLRGSQTLGELRINSDRLHRFADIRRWTRSCRNCRAPSGAMVAELPRSPGRERIVDALLPGARPPESVPSDSSAPLAGTSSH